MKIVNSLATSFVLATGICSGAIAQTWNMPTPYPDGNFQTENVRWFADEVGKATNGDFKLEVHSGASMFKMGELKRALRTGQVPIAEFFISAYGNENPIYDADSIPFMAIGQDQAKKLYEIQKPFLEKQFEKEGLVPLYSVVWPGQGMYTKNPVNSIAEMKGLKFRAQTPIVARLGELMGAVPVNVQFVEVPQAFQTGVISAMVTAGTTGVDTQAWEYTDYFYDLSAFHPRNIVAVNAKAWNALPESTRKTILEVAQKAEERGWQRAAALQADARKTLADKGMKVVDASPELMIELKAIGDKMIDEWTARAGEDGKKIAEQMKAASTQ